MCEWAAARLSAGNEAGPLKMEKMELFSPKHCFGGLKHLWWEPGATGSRSEWSNWPLTSDHPPDGRSGSYVSFRYKYTFLSAKGGQASCGGQNWSTLFLFYFVPNQFPVQLTLVPFDCLRPVGMRLENQLSISLSRRTDRQTDRRQLSHNLL